MRKFWRWIGAAYAVMILAATSGAPHHHLNGIEDLLWDGPSDSGLVFVGSAFQSAGSPVIEAAPILDDDWGLACFPHDFVAARVPRLRAEHRWHVRALATHEFPRNAASALRTARIEKGRCDDQLN